MNITNEQWQQVVSFISNTLKGPRGQGRPVLHEPRAILNGILWILRTGAPWKDLPKSTHRTKPVPDGFNDGEKKAYSIPCYWLWQKIYEHEANLICGKPSLTGHSLPQKRGNAVGKTKHGKGTKIMAVADASGFPLALHVTNAPSHEVTLVEETLNREFTNQFPRYLIGDNVYDSGKLDANSKGNWGIEMIAPNRKKRNKTQDGRPPGRYRRRWKVERLFAWLDNFRRLVVRYEFYAENFLAMVQLGCVIIFLRLVMRLLLVSQHN